MEATPQLQQPALRNVRLAGTEMAGFVTPRVKAAVRCLTPEIRKRARTKCSFELRDHMAPAHQAK
ncbi:hypothetical protein CLAFUW4_01381 [Fulvia fulva]|uniref:Uncharacterized protein n=1 Tax=Passalora fulva TaxID=5499 RepID=A0A9Q8L9N0_PASFU|nr:uncharacterized protein CLAFUR5_01383 [Fulvia fulva]KAK4636339.1 hypothetical protein CLAFUR4_01382 [Fulvia fulva]KAK4638412.1 hypothetical protein CLAFUR0_01383 [Fulvia fulva]UJO12743.1 hypothetical protein CLAFUR5_01383 [Fulvia fulva]WPV09846.1 hypothetical protein CLAFUW4_01381 [Fulvia fulva]WPV25025.1 hypothetical protein CLAFUW7_01386 [Fulvia fulva]